MDALTATYRRATGDESMIEERKRASCVKQVDKPSRLHGRPALSHAPRLSHPSRADPEPIVSEVMRQMFEDPSNVAGVTIRLAHPAITPERRDSQVDIRA